MRTLCRLLTLLITLITLSLPAQAMDSDTIAWLKKWRAANANWRGIHLMISSDSALQSLQEQLPKLTAIGINSLIVELNYHFAYTKHPELQAETTVSQETARRFAAACRAQGVRPIPMFNCIGHQSWAGTTFALLRQYPELDETPGQFPDNKGIYCRSWCTRHPKVNRLVFSLIDELIEAFSADAFHVGMDEIFLIGSEHCPRCQGRDPGKLLASAVNELHRHLVNGRRVEMLMWGDRLLDGKATGYGEWEASLNGTAGAIDLIPKDIIQCDWHYEKRAEYPSVPLFLEKGFRVWPGGWKNTEATEALARYAQSYRGPRLLGYLCTTWGAVKVPDLDQWPPIRKAMSLWRP